MTKERSGDTPKGADLTVFALCSRLLARCGLPSASGRGSRQPPPPITRLLVAFVAPGLLQDARLLENALEPLQSGIQRLVLSHVNTTWQ